jgi:hypothetical protein
MPSELQQAEPAQLDHNAYAVLMMELVRQRPKAVARLLADFCVADGLKGEQRSEEFAFSQSELNFAIRQFLNGKRGAK